MYHHGSVLSEYSGLVDGGEADEGACVEITEHGYVFGTLPSNIDKKVPTIGLIAHVDTSPEVSGENVNPIIHENYKGGDITLPKDL